MLFSALPSYVLYVCVFCLVQREQRENQSPGPCKYTHLAKHVNIYTYLICIETLILIVVVKREHSEPD